MSQRHYSLLDRLLSHVEYALNTVFTPTEAARPNPSINIPNNTLAESDRRRSAGMMRINHSGEVCAQALYQGQLLVARNHQTKMLLKQAANEEMDHLAWTKSRLIELNSHTSYLNLMWYINSFATGIIAGIAGDSWSLGFVEETESQVSNHLAKHLGDLPLDDHKSRAIIHQMKLDEEQHGATAQQAGAKSLPVFFKKIMSYQAKIMTTLAFWV